MQMKRTHMECQREEHPEWFSSSESDSSPRPKQMVSRKRDEEIHLLTPEYLDQDELQRTLDHGRKDLRLDFRSMGDCYQVRGHVEHTDLV